MRRRVVLMRHGQVSYFPKDSQPADPLTVPLTERGREQARAAGALLADVDFDLCVHSGLRRTRETAELVLAGRERRPETREDAALRELSTAHAALGTVSRQGLEQTFTQAFVRAADPDARFLGGERFTDARSRVLERWRALLADTSWRTALVVAHGGVNRILLAHALGAGPAAYGSLEQEAACVNIIDVDPPDERYPEGRHILRLMNYSPYDPVKRRHTLTTMERLWQAFASRDAAP